MSEKNRKRHDPRHNGILRTLLNCKFIIRMLHYCTLMLGGVAEYCGFITKQGWRCLTGSNTTAYYVKVSIAHKQSSITLT